VRLTKEREARIREDCTKRVVMRDEWASHAGALLAELDAVRAERDAFAELADACHNGEYWEGGGVELARKKLERLKP